MAFQVYPGAIHGRLEHVIGVVEAAERMISSLERNALHRREFGDDKDPEIPLPTEDERRTIRLAALLHDVGHGPFSHATENLIRTRFKREFDTLEDRLRKLFRFSEAKRIPASEQIAVLMVLSEAMEKVITHARFEATKKKTELASSIAARIIGAPTYIGTSYLSGIVSGPIDADKLDYMARDSYHAGLRTGFDFERLISKLEVVTVTPDNAPDPDLRRRAQKSSGQRFHDIGISLAGLGAFEQMIITRVFLYDRLYYHHKVRSAEALVRRLIRVAEEERGGAFSLRELFRPVSDDTMTSLIAGFSKEFRGGKNRSVQICLNIQSRHLYHRAFVFAARFIAGIEHLRREEEINQRVLLWGPILMQVDTPVGRQFLAKEIYETANSLSTVKGLEDAVSLLPEHILVDFPRNKVAVTAEILTRTEDGQVSIPTVFFNAVKWSQAYENQKQCGYVFAPKRFVPLVALAARIVFSKKFNVQMGMASEQESKMTGAVPEEWIKDAIQEGLCPEDLLSKQVLHRAGFEEFEFTLPDQWLDLDPSCRRRLAGDLNKCLSTGLDSRAHKGIRLGIEQLAHYVRRVEETGEWTNRDTLAEEELQRDVRKHLLSREVEVIEKNRIGGGESDLYFPDWNLILENKFRRQKTKDPYDVGKNYSWQSRRYDIAVCSQIHFVVLAFRPADETCIPVQPTRIGVIQLPKDPSGHVEVRVCIPWGMGVPSRAEAPKEI